LLPRRAMATEPRRPGRPPTHDRHGLTTTERRVFPAIVQCAIRRPGRGWACGQTYEQIAEGAGCSVSTIDRAIPKLVTAGKINKPKRKTRITADGRRFRYVVEITFPKGTRRLPRAHPNSSRTPDYTPPAPSEGVSDATPTAEPSDLAEQQDL